MSTGSPSLKLTWSLCSTEQRTLLPTPAKHTLSHTTRAHLLAQWEEKCFSDEGRPALCSWMPMGVSVRQSNSKSPCEEAGDSPSNSVVPISKSYVFSPQPSNTHTCTHTERGVGVPYQSISERLWSKHLREVVGEKHSGFINCLALLGPTDFLLHLWEGKYHLRKNLI